MTHNAKISLIAAIGKRRELGKENKLIWKIPEDLARFKRLTMNHTIIMGRKTFESIGRVLPHRVNIIITHNSKYHADGTIVVHSLAEALEAASSKYQALSVKEVFIIGGAQIFEQAIKAADKLYLTIIDENADADAYFPPYSQFKKVIFKETHKENTPAFTFLDIEK